MIEENPWPIEVLVEIFKWFSIEERLKQLAPVWKLFHQAVHTPKFWKIVDTNSEFTLSSFHSVFGHAKHITHLDFRYSQRQLGCRNLIENALNDCVNLAHLDLAYNTSIFTLFFIQSMPFLAELWRAKRACGAPWVSKSTHPRKFGNHVTVYRPPVRPHHRATNVHSS